MLVKDCMTRHPIMISPETPAAEAQKIMSENKVRHLPVVGDGKRLMGLVTQSSFSIKPDMLGSLNVWEISRRLSDVKVKQVMVKADKVVTVAPDRTAERAARMMKDHKLGCLPVIDDGIVVGILSETDLLQAFQEMLGLPATGVRVIMRMPNRPGEFAKLMNIMAKQNWGVMGIGTYPSRRVEGYYDAVLKIPDVTLEDVRAKLIEVEGQEIVDIRDVV